MYKIHIKVHLKILKKKKFIRKKTNGGQPWTLGAVNHRNRRYTIFQYTECAPLLILNRT